MMETADRAIGEIGRLSRLLIDKQVDIERLRVALGVARGALVSLRDGAQADGDLGKSSLIQTHINIVDRAFQQNVEPK